MQSNGTEHEKPTASADNAPQEQSFSSELAVASDVLPSHLHILPVFERPFLPAQAQPIVVDEDPWLATLKAVGEMPQRVLGLVLVIAEPTEALHVDHVARTGTVIRVHHPVQSEGKIQFIAEGLRRFRVLNWLSEKPPLLAQVDYPEEAIEPDTDEVRAYAMAIINTLRELIPLNPLYSEELKVFLKRFSPNQPSRLTDFAATLSTAPKDELQTVLDTVPLMRRMEKVLLLLKRELEVAKLQSKIREQVEQQMSEQQRKFFLREQLRVIQQELGISKDDRTADLERFRRRLGELEVPGEAKQRIDDEMGKLSILETGSPEYAVTRNYLDTITSLPWGRCSDDILDLRRARRILDRDHDGLDDIKERIVEFLVVGTLRGQVGGSILLLVGPPGVGKTSIGRSVAEALGRRFYRFSVGGMRDEAEIKGHRRTYIGAMPGKFVQAIKTVGTVNPVVMLDEIDKIGASFHGDPASALLEVLDPEQNSDFLDHYLDVRFDLSKVFFICTANQIDTIPSPLLDRMELLRLAGYITEEKVTIAQHHLWPRQLERAGLSRRHIRITKTALRKLIEGYAREAGIRNLEKQLGRLVRKAAVRIVGGAVDGIRIGPAELEEYLGKPIFREEKPLHGIGVVTGLAWTALGGATLPVEATRVHTKNRGFKLTGKLGDVMRESAEIAYSYVSSHLHDYHGDPTFFDEAFVHLHVPEGATPKDGPSAGVTMATALLSLARGERVRRRIAMTGELTLTGRIYPVGGIREKVIAARRAKVMELVLPEDNRRDYDELPQHIRAGMSVNFVERFDDVVPLVFLRRARLQV